MKTNCKEVKNAIRAHILESVTDENEESFPTVEGAIAYLKGEFERVANYPQNLRRIPNDQERFHDYLMGIPFGFEFEYNSIASFLNSLGINPQGKDLSSEKSARLYTYLIFKEIA
jgi:O6-methylguanine-DNA--protein-cysteine methyltransferase